MIRIPSSLAFIFLLAACHSHGGENGAMMPGDPEDHRPYGEIAQTEVLNLVGTEPFWGGTIEGSTLTYTTPGNEAGAKIEVQRFGGRGGLGLSGTYDGKPFDMTVTPGTCSDGMSDRSYPFTVTMRISGEPRQGCAWSKAHGYHGPKQP